MTDSTIVERDELAIQFVAATDGIAGARRAWTELEAAVGSLQGRHFYGAFDPATNDYRACVEVGGGDELVPGLESGTLPGGRYRRARLTGDPPGVYERIGPTFEQLATHGGADPERPGLEHYRRHDEIDLLLPVR